MADFEAFVGVSSGAPDLASSNLAGVADRPGVAGRSGKAGVIWDDTARLKLLLLDGREEGRDKFPPSRSGKAVGRRGRPGGAAGVDRLLSWTI